MPDARQIERVVCYWHITRRASADAVVVFKIQHIMFTDGTVHSEYGGYEGKWQPFQEFDTLELFEGTLMIPGMEWVQCGGKTWEKYMEWLESHA